MQQKNKKEKKNHSETQEQWGRGVAIILNTIDAQTVFWGCVIPQSSLKTKKKKKKKPKWSHRPCHCLTCLLYPSSAPLQVLRIWGWAQRGPPDNPPHWWRSQVGGLSQTEARHIVQIIYGLCRLKLRWSRGVSLSSLALSPCTTFRPDSRFSVFWVVLIHKFPHFLGGEYWS